MAFADWARIEKTSSTGQAEIGARRIYILPTRYGVIYAILLFLMLLGAVNYGNNPAHLLTFLLAALGSNAIYQTWRNLRGLQLICRGAAPVFEGERAAFIVRLRPGGRARPAIQLMFEDNEPALLDLESDEEQTCTLGLDGLPRGLHRTGRLVLSTQYPLGLFRAWCYVDCAHPVLVYPRPGDPWSPPGSAVQIGETGEEGQGNEDFAGLRNYQPGDQPSRIDWKSYARDRGLNTRLFAGQTQAPLWIRWADTPAVHEETRLQLMTRAVLDADSAGRSFGIDLGQGGNLTGSGSRHRHQCLRQLALYGTPDA